MRLTSFVSASSIALLLAPSFAQTIVERAQRDEITIMANEEPAMRRAFERASATLDQFLAEARAPKPGTSSYAMKVALSDGRNNEYVWINDFVAVGDRFSGVLDNEPRMVKTHKLGERIEFSRMQVVDWTSNDRAGGRMVGNFTACALLSKEPPAQAEEFKRRYGLKCE